MKSVRNKNSVRKKLSEKFTLISQISTDYLSQRTQRRVTLNGYYSPLIFFIVAVMNAFASGVLRTRATAKTVSKA